MGSGTMGRANDPVPRRAHHAHDRGGLQGDFREAELSGKASEGELRV